jgi:hypothetical protein
MRKLFKKRKKSSKIIRIDLRDLETEIILIESGNIVFQGRLFSMDLSRGLRTYSTHGGNTLRLEFYKE